MTDPVLTDPVLTDPVLVEVADGVLVATLNRPAARNAIDAALADGLAAALAELDERPDLAVGVLAGAGAGFCAGMDLKAFAAGERSDRLAGLLRHGTRKPLVAAVEGFALAGGLELALLADVIVAARGARLGLPEVGVGLLAAGGGLLRLPRRLPYGAAATMALTGEPMTAEWAHRHGLVTTLVEPGEARGAAVALAGRIAARAPLAVAATKELLARAHGPDDEYWRHQGPVAARVFGSADAVEGATAFAERRPPRWSGA